MEFKPAAVQSNNRGLPAFDGSDVTVSCLGDIFQNKVGASPAIRGVSERKMAVTPGNNATSLLARVTAPGLPCPATIEHRLKKSM